MSGDNLNIWIYNYMIAFSVEYNISLIIVFRKLEIRPASSCQ